jgi:hypothetical protein
MRNVIIAAAFNTASAILKRNKVQTAIKIAALAIASVMATVPGNPARSQAVHESPEGSPKSGFGYKYRPDDRSPRLENGYSYGAGSCERIDETAIILPASGCGFNDLSVPNPGRYQAYYKSNEAEQKCERLLTFLRCAPEP